MEALNAELEAAQATIHEAEVSQITLDGWPFQ
jgi:hypothetical protein